jgi:hypothetical protein
MARYEGEGTIRRALSLPDGRAQLDIRPDGQNWHWYFSTPARGREALACGLTAISGGWKVYISLPDDPNVDVLEIFGVAKTRDQN